MQKRTLGLEIQKLVLLLLVFQMGVGPAALAARKKKEEIQRVDCATQIAQLSPVTKEVVVWETVKNSSSPTVKRVSQELIPMIMDRLTAAGVSVEDPSFRTEVEKLTSAVLGDLFPTKKTSWLSMFLAVVAVALHRVGLAPPKVHIAATRHMADALETALSPETREIFYHKFLRTLHEGAGAASDLKDKINAILERTDLSEDRKVHLVSREFGFLLSSGEDYPHLLEAAWRTSPFIATLSPELFQQILFYTKTAVASQTSLSLSDLPVPDTAVELLLRVWFRRALRSPLTNQILTSWHSVARENAATFLSEHPVSLHEVLSRFMESEKRLPYLPDFVVLLMQIGDSSFINDKAQAIREITTNLAVPAGQENPLREIRHSFLLAPAHPAEIFDYLGPLGPWYQADPALSSLMRLYEKLRRFSGWETIFDPFREKVGALVFADSPTPNIAVARLEAIEKILFDSAETQSDRMMEKLNTSDNVGSF
jgi:hypothetical protein